MEIFRMNRSQAVEKFGEGNQTIGQLLKKNGWVMGIASREGGGTTFYIWIPAEQLIDLKKFGF